jgi:diacylglycerol kinase
MRNTIQQMKPKRKNIVVNFICALRGFFITFKSERNFKIYTIALCVTIALGIYLGLQVLEWALIIFSTGLVLAAEIFNTAIERLGDEVAGGNLMQNVKNIKDISAAAVLVAGLTALAIGIIILFIPLIRHIFN